MLASPQTPVTGATLLDKLKRRIAREGPLTIAQYMEASLADPEHGYYTTRDPFGRAGDFVTAPEISQIFGELIGLWCAVAWREMGAPGAVKVIELGPGRGTLMADALRASSCVPEFVSAVEVHLVEASPSLRAVQRETLARSGTTPRWHDRLADVPTGTAIILANEFLDVLPVRQFERVDGAWRERCIRLSDNGRLEIGVSPEVLATPEIIPQALRDAARDGELAEIRPGTQEIVEVIAARAEDAPAAALFIDYGHATTAPGETLQAVKEHDYTDPLAAPGTADLTAHVDFGAICETAQQNGLQVHGPVTQAAFLLSLGLKERCEKLLENARADQRELIASGAERLVDPAQMGELFKVMALSSKGLRLVPFGSGAAAERNT